MEQPIAALLIAAALLVLAQALFSLYVMCFTWEHPERLEASHGPRQFPRSNLSFAVLVPARREKAVIFDTILRIWKARYPLRDPAEPPDEYAIARRRQFEI